MCGTVELESATVPEYLARAIEFLNSTVWGTLSTTLMVSKDSLDDPMTEDAVARVMADLRYGTVALNVPGTCGIYSMIAPRGGYPGSDIFDIQSGNGRVANFLMLHRPEKTVVRAPFRMIPYPFLGTAKNLYVFCRKLTAFEAKPSYWMLPGLFWRAARI